MQNALNAGIGIKAAMKNAIAFEKEVSIMLTPVVLKQ